MSQDFETVFLVQYDRQERFISTAAIVTRDIPEFDRTGPNGSDLYGDHWIANVFSLYRRRGYGTRQIEALKHVALRKGWPHLWLYCKDFQDGVNLPKYYREKHGFCLSGKELVSTAFGAEKENIMRFDTAMMHPAIT